MALWMMANTAEVVRGGIQSIPRGQTEAARSTGLSGLQTMRHVIFPQAVRRMLPPFSLLAQRAESRLRRS